MMCPPSSGGSGSRLKKNSEKFSPVSRITRKNSLVRFGIPSWAATCPDRSPMPTTEMGESSARGASVKVVTANSGIFSGNATTAWAMSLMESATSAGSWATGICS